MIEVKGVNRRTGEEVDTAVLEETGTAFDPGKMHMELSKDEKLRTTALLLAIQAYQHLIIKDAEYYEAVCRENRTTNQPPVRPATIHSMTLAAIEFEDFITGRLRRMVNVSRSDDENATAADGRDPLPDEDGRTD